MHNSQTIPKAIESVVMHTTAQPKAQSDNYPPIGLLHPPLNKLANKMVKRCFDILFSAVVLLLILSWLIPLLAILIKITSKGSIFFVQPRTGLNNKTFNCWKLRTMVRNQEANVKQASSGDLRITFAGKYLRKFSLDELPQFYNVFIGNMSIIGPRPHMLFHTEEFAKEVDFYNTRHLVKPGITGLAQVLGFRGEITNHQAIRSRTKLDVFYIQNWSLAFDFYIIYKTIRLLIFGDKHAA